VRPSAAWVAAGLMSAAAGAAGFEVELSAPPAGQAAFGLVRVVASVFPPGAVERVEFFVDGRRVGVVVESPHELVVDVGQENVAHEFRVVAHGPGAATAAAAVTTPAIRVDAQFSVELQQLYVTARLGGRRVLDLTQDDFEVLDEGRRQELVTFARGDIPFTAVVLVDASLSMDANKLAIALAGARAFVGGMRPLDEAKVVVFSDRMIAATRFAGPADVAAFDLGEPVATGGTSVNDHLYLALKLLEARQGRRVVVLLSDGMDTTSALRLREVLFKVRQSQALVYWIRPLERGGRVLDPDRARRLYSAWKSGAEHADELDLLAEVVAESGGRILEGNPLDDLTAEFDEVLRELREQYVLGFYPAGARHDGRWHRVEVRVRRPGVGARAGGYLDF
jgi:Ca-activated chloride channel homolog